MGLIHPYALFEQWDGQPLFIEKGEGPFLFDVDGNQYIDYVLSWGPLILGHAHPQVVHALAEAIAKGTSYGAPSPLEVELARLIQDFMPAIAMMKFCQLRHRGDDDSFTISPGLHREDQNYQV